MTALPEPPRGFRYYQTRSDLVDDPELFTYQHLLLRAWDEMELSGVLTLDGIPTVYVRDTTRALTPAETATVHCQFWNQGVATVLLLRDPEHIRVFSSMTAPVDPATVDDEMMDARVVETVGRADQAMWAARFFLQLGTGQYYQDAHEPLFAPEQTVDSYLLNNLAALRDELTSGEAALSPAVAHSFLGRLLFTSYLCDRGIIELGNYFPGKPWRRLRDLLAAYAGRDVRPALYSVLFQKLRHEFNSSMFDDDLASEREAIQPAHVGVVRSFLDGDAVHRGQRSLGFWAYDFKFIPVETISAIYENFLEKEGGPEKRTSGAYYTPRFLAELTLDFALEGVRPLRGQRYLDPACGSGIFLVLLFNRLAAEWNASLEEPASPQQTARSLLELLGLLRGVDKHPTACRITCFSLYLAFLDRFNPPDVRAYMETTGERLPNLLQFADSRKKKPALPVVWEGDFLALANGWDKQFDVVVGNPPWAGRGKKQIVHRFMETIPDVLRPTGRASLVLPSKVFLNQTDALQARWLRRVTLERVLQLADYRFILFKEALCPSSIVRFTGARPDPATTAIEYITPKVSRVDLRDGVIPIAPTDRKSIPLHLLLGAADNRATSLVWKSYLWGTERDLKFLDFLFALPKLGELVGTVKQMEQGKRRWCKGQGFQPLRPKSKTDRPVSMPWPLSDRFVTPDRIEGLLCVPERMTFELGDYLEANGYRLDKLHRARKERIYQPPLVLWNQGFSSAAFFDYRVRFQHSLQSISGPEGDSDALLFLTAFLRSRLARYFVFHTAGNVGTERDKVHLPEVLRLPFYLPDSEVASAEAADLVARIAAKIRHVAVETKKDLDILLKKRSGPNSGPLFGDVEEEEDRAAAWQKWLSRQREKTSRLQAELDQLVYRYFGLSKEEVALVEDTCDIFDRSDTPASLEAAKNIPTLQTADGEILARYADTLTGALNRWASGQTRVIAHGGVDNRFGLALVELVQAKTTQPYRSRSISGELARALQRLQDASTEQVGRLAYLRGLWIFEGTRILLVKPALFGRWTRTEALNDAAALYGHIKATQRQREAP